MTTPPLIIDSFAGGGGASTGIEMALGRSPDIAINHDASALALHEANHPDTLHLNSNIWDVDPMEAVKGREVGLLWASPDCKHFSKAKGGKPRSRNIRDLAWVIVKWAEFVKPDVILMENVEEFRTWGPLCDEGKPIKGLEGTTFELWVARLKKAGYKVDWNELRACDFGDPTIRKRFFMVARRDGRPIVWPKPTHGAPDSKGVKSGKLKPWRTAAECIDWSLPCPSIFDTSAEIKEKHGLTAKRPLAENTLARVARGMKRYVLDADNPFLVNLTHGGRCEDASLPFKTITGANRGEKAAIVPSITKFNSGATGHGIGEPMSTITANSFVKRPGGAAPIGLLAPSLATFYGHNNGRGKRAADLLQPLRTVTVENRHALVAPTLANVANGKTTGRGPNAWHVAEPSRTITSSNGFCLVAPNLLSLKGTSRRASAATLPHPTVLAGGGHSAVVAPVLTYAQHGGSNRPVTDPHHTICANSKDQNSVIVPMMVQTGYGERKGQKPRSLDLHAPLGTAVAGGIKHAPVSAFLAQHNKARNGFNPGRSADAPLSTLTGTGSQQSLVTAWFSKYYGTGDGARMDEPCHTVTVRDRYGHMQADLDVPPFTDEHKARAREVAEFLRAHGAWDGGEFVTLDIAGETYVVVDIGLRMLTPRELFRAQGFPEGYVIEGVWNHDTENDEWKWRPFTKSTQVSCCGNSVCPGMARALADANCGHLQSASVAA